MIFEHKLWPINTQTQKNGEKVEFIEGTVHHFLYFKFFYYSRKYIHWATFFFLRDWVGQPSYEKSSFSLVGMEETNEGTFCAQC